MTRLRAWYADLDRKMRFSVWLLAVSTVVYPLAAWWVWWYMGKFAPFEQVMLLISFGAIVVTAINILFTNSAASGCTCCPTHGPDGDGPH